MPRPRIRIYKVYCGDAEHWFSYTRKQYTMEEIEKILAERIEPLRLEILPGLLFQNMETGELLRPQLNIGLVPAGVTPEKEEPNEGV